MARACVRVAGSWGAGGSALGYGRGDEIDKSLTGSVYETGMTLLALSVPFRQLPIYQRDATIEEEE